MSIFDLEIKTSQLNFLYKKYIDSLKVRPLPAATNLSGNRSNAQVEVKKIYRAAMWRAGWLGALGVFLFYTPLHLFPEFFQDQLTLNLFGATIQLPWVEITWCAFLTFLELFLLTLVHLKMVHSIAIASGVLNLSNKSHLLQDLFSVATLQNDKSIKGLGLNPYQGISKFVLLLINVLNMLKAVIANKVLRYILQRFLSRYVAKYFLDIAGTPIYVLLNLYVTRRIYNDLFASLYGRKAISEYLQNLEKRELAESEKKLVYDAVQLVVMSKRGFHPNHAFLTRELFQFFQISIERKHELPENFTYKLQEADHAVQKLCREVIILGFILDGKISFFERRRFRILFAQDKTGKVVSEKELERAADMFKRGNTSEIRFISGSNS